MEGATPVPTWLTLTLGAFAFCAGLGTLIWAIGPGFDRAIARAEASVIDDEYRGLCDHA